MKPFNLLDHHSLIINILISHICQFNETVSMANCNMNLTKPGVFSQTGKQTAMAAGVQLLKCGVEAKFNSIYAPQCSIRCRSTVYYISDLVSVFTRLLVPFPGL